MKKVLLTSGCSFTVSPHSWANHLSTYLNLELVNYGQSSRGNGYISRSVIYGLSDLLKKYKNSEILVGIMWSAPSRHEFYNLNIDHNVIDKSSHNPHSFINGSKNWIGLNQHWNDKTSKMYYKHFYDEDAAFIHTLEHILRVQWFLKNNNIDYFMSTYSDIVLPKKDKLDVEEIAYLYHMIDFSRFLDVKSCIDWCVEDSMIPMTHEPKYPSRYAQHPSKEHQQAFTEKVILPFIDKNIYPCKEGEEDEL